MSECNHAHKTQRLSAFAEARSSQHHRTYDRGASITSEVLGSTMEVRLEVQASLNDDRQESRSVALRAAFICSRIAGRMLCEHEILCLMLQCC
jgi:hypothetical protein